MSDNSYDTGKPSDWTLNQEMSDNYINEWQFLCKDINQKKLKPI